MVHEIKALVLTPPPLQTCASKSTTFFKPNPNVLAKLVDVDDVVRLNDVLIFEYDE